MYICIYISILGNKHLSNVLFEHAWFSYTITYMYIINLRSNSIWNQSGASQANKIPNYHIMW